MLKSFVSIKVLLSYTLYAWVDIKIRPENAAKWSMKLRLLLFEVVAKAVAMFAQVVCSEIFVKLSYQTSTNGVHWSLIDLITWCTLMSRPRSRSGYTLPSVRGGTRTNQSAKKTIYWTTASLLKKWFRGKRAKANSLY